MIRRALHKATRSALVAYLILAVGVGASLVRTQQFNNESRHKLCLIAISSWDERDAIVNSLTEHGTLPPGLHLSDPSTQALQLAIVHANERRDRERAHLLRLQGPRPRC